MKRYGTCVLRMDMEERWRFEMDDDGVSIKRGYETIASRDIAFYTLSDVEQAAIMYSLLEEAQKNHTDVPDPETWPASFADWPHDRK